MPVLRRQNSLGLGWAFFKWCQHLRSLILVIGYRPQETQDFTLIYPGKLAAVSVAQVLLETGCSCNSCVLWSRKKNILARIQAPFSVVLVISA